jgi:hypothetical protein
MSPAYTSGKPAFLQQPLWITITVQQFDYGEGGISAGTVSICTHGLA